MDIDPILLRLVNQDLYPSFKDPRHCLVFWARPTTDIKQLTHQIQVKLRIILPSIEQNYDWSVTVEPDIA